MMFSGMGSALSKPTTNFKYIPNSMFCQDPLDFAMRSQSISNPNYLATFSHIILVISHILIPYRQLPAQNHNPFPGNILHNLGILSTGSDYS